MWAPESEGSGGRNQENNSGNFRQWKQRPLSGRLSRRAGGRREGPAGNRGDKAAVAVCSQTAGSPGH